RLQTDSVLTSKNILNRPQSVTLLVGRAQISQTTYDYDTKPLTTLSQSIFNHTDDADVHRGNLTHIARWTGGTSFLDTFFTYDTTGQLVQIQDPLGNATGISYTDNFFNDNGTSQLPSANPSKVTNAYPSTITLPGVGNIGIGYYFGSGKEAFVVDPNGQHTYEHYRDPLDRATQIVTPKGWTALSYSSPLDADVFSGITDTQPSTTCSGCMHTQISLDQNGFPAQTTLASDPAGPVTAAAFYDIMGNVLLSTNPTRGQLHINNDPQTLTTNTYDILYRLTKTVNPDGSSANVFYGDDPGLATAGGTFTQSCPAVAYGFGFATLSVDEVGRKQEVWQDAFGRIIEADEPDASGNFTVATCYEYNAGNELTEVRQGALARSYKYDPLWRVTQVTTPEAGTETFSYLNDNGTFCSKDPGAVCKRVDARGIITRYQYDVAGRLVQKTYSDGTPTAVFNYSEPTALGGLAQLTNTIGRLSSMYTQDSSGKMLAGEAFSYDSAGNTIANPQCTPQNCGTGLFQNNYTPDLLGNVTNFTNSWGRTVNASYNNAVQLTSLGVTPSDATHPGTVFSNPKYNEFGSVTEVRLGNGLTDARGYTTTRGTLNSVRVGSRSDFNQPAPGNVALPGGIILNISGSLKQATTTAKPGSAVLSIAGFIRQIPNGTQQPLPSSGTLTISGHEQLKQSIQTSATAGTGSIAFSGNLQSKSVLVQQAIPAAATVVLSGHQQSKIVIAQPALAGTDTLTISGTLQSTQKQEPGTNANGSISMNGTLASTHVGGAPAKQATGSITISGNEKSVTYPGDRFCGDFSGNPP